MCGIAGLWIPAGAPRERLERQALAMTRSPDRRLRT